MSLLRISAAEQSLCTELVMDEAAVKSAVKEAQADPTEEKRFCPESQKRWFERIPEAPAFVLEENTNEKTTSEKHPGGSIVEEVAQKGKAKCCLGRGMRALLQN